VIDEIKVYRSMHARWAIVSALVLVTHQSIDAKATNAVALLFPASPFSQSSSKSKSCAGQNPSPCELTAADNLDGPYGLAFDDGFAYITNAGASSVTRCMVNTSTGDLGPGCEQSTSLTLSRPVGIVFPPQV